MTTLGKLVVAQFGRPHGPLGRLAGLVMWLRPSNRERNRRVLALLDVRPEDRVLEVGFGPGLAIALAAERASRGRVVGIDHSELMWRQASRRNAAAIAVGRVELHLGAAEHLPAFSTRFDKAYGINVHMFWREPVAVLRGLRDVLVPGGTLALGYQPRQRGAAAADTRLAAERMTAALREAAFTNVRAEILPLRPVDLACALGQAPS